MTKPDKAATKTAKDVKPKSASPKKKRVLKPDLAKAPAKAPVSSVDETNNSGPRVRVKIKAYDHKIIDTATKTIIDTAERNNVKVIGPVPLPTQINKYSVNRATFVHKTAQEQYEMRTHKRLIDIVSPTPKALDALMNLNLPSGVDVEIKMM